MATDFGTNVTLTKGSFKPTSPDMPLDIRTRIESISEVSSIPMPYVGMVFFVKDTGKRYEVVSLKDKKSGMSTIKKGMVDQYKELPYVTREEVEGNYASKIELDAKVDKEEGKGLSSNDFTELLKAKLEALPTAEQIEEMIRNNTGSGDCGFTLDHKNAIENELISRVSQDETGIKFYSRSNNVISQVEVMDSNDIQSIISLLN